MPAHIENRRVLLAAKKAQVEELRNMFCEIPLQHWDVLEAESFERARFLLQHNPCDVLLVDESLCHSAGQAGLAWVARQQEPPTVLLCGMEPSSIVQAYEHGVSLCVPRKLSLGHPQVLAAALKRTIQISEMQHITRRTTDRLFKCRRQVDRLVNLLWRSIPMDSEHQWFTHRHVMERLQEEVARCGRHGEIFTVAVGEVENEVATKPEADDIGEWTSAVVSKAKRRCDVAGYYGLKGFMLLMVQTPQKGGITCCKRLQNQLQDAAKKATGPRGPIRASFGLSSFSPDNASSEGLLVRAEKNLQEAKVGAGGGIVAD